MSNSIDGGHMRSLIERIERVEQTIREEQEARKEIYSEAKSAGFDPKVMREVVRIRKQDRDKRAEFEGMLDVYKSALGILADTPLGIAAVARDLGAHA